MIQTPTALIDIAVFLLFIAGPAAVFVFAGRCGDFYAPMLSGTILGCICCAAILLCGRIIRGGPPLRWNGIFSWTAVFISTAFLSSINSANPQQVFRAAFVLCIFALAAYFLFCSISDSSAPFRPLSFVPIFGAIFSIIALAQFFGFDVIPLKSRYAYDAWKGFHAYAVFGNANLLADFLAICIPVAAGAAFSAKKFAARAFYFACAALMFACVTLTSSRGAMLGTIAGAAVFAFFLLFKTRRTIAPGGILLILLLCGAGFVFKTTGGEYFKQNSIRLRIMTWKVSLLMIKDSPLTGVGLDRFGSEYLRYQAKYFSNPSNAADAPLANIEKQRHAHNEFVQTAAETGIIGFAAFVGLLGSIALRLLKSRTGHTKEDAIPVALIGSLAAFCVVSLFSFPMRIPLTEALFALLVSCAAACPAHPAENARKFSVRLPGFFSVPRVRVEISALIVLIGFLAFLDFSVEPLLSSVFTRIGMVALDGAQDRYAESMCGKALSADRLNGGAAYCLGMAGLSREHPDDAIYYFTRSLKNIDDPMIHYYLSSAFASMSDFEKAESELLKMQAMVPAFPLPRMELAKFYAATGRTDDSERKYREAITVLKAQAAAEPGNPTPILMLANCYYSIGDILSYREMLRAALKLRPDDPRIEDALNASESLRK